MQDQRTKTLTTSSKKPVSVSLTGLATLSQAQTFVRFLGNSAEQSEPTDLFKLVDSSGPG